MPAHSELMIERMAESAGVMVYPYLLAWPVLIALAVLCPLAWWLADVLRGSHMLAVAAAAFLAAAVTLAIARPGLRSMDADWDRLPSVCRITDARTLTTEGLLNLLLLVPFAVLAVLAVGHPISVAVVAATASVGVESVQAVYAIGACDSSDVVRNSAGALVGALLAAIVRLIWSLGKGGSVRKGGQAVKASAVMDFALDSTAAQERSHAGAARGRQY